MMKRDMSDAPLHIVFALFDANQDGNLASGELVAVGQTPHSLWLVTCTPALN